MNNNDNKIEIIENIDFNQIPSVMKKAFHNLDEFKKSVQDALDRANDAESCASSAKNKSAGFGHKKEAIESLQEAAVALADAQILSAKAQKISFEYQQKLGELTKMLIVLGVHDIANNRCIVQELKMRLNGASEKEIDELERKEIISGTMSIKSTN